MVFQKAQNVIPICLADYTKMLFSSRFWLVTSKNIYIKKKHWKLLIDLFLI